jgi:uncharacterized protein
MRYILTLLFLVSVVMLPAQSTVESIPNQKLINGSYVSNPDEILDATTVFQLDTLLASLEKRTTAQVAVVIVESIGEQDIVDFAQMLFTTWGIGNKERDNGLLVLLVKDQRTVRFHTGYGLEGILPDITCKRIQREVMVPEFKNENYNAGILAGVQEVSKVLTNPDYAVELAEPESDTTSNWSGFTILLLVFVAPAALIVYIVKAVSGNFADSKKVVYTPYPEMRLSRFTWLTVFVGIPILIVVLFGVSPVENAAVLCCASLYLYFMVTLFYRLWRMKKVINRFAEVQQYHEIVEFIRKQQLFWFFMALAFPLPFIFYFPYHLVRKRIYRDHSRNCKQCQGALRKLRGKEEYIYLSEGMQMEEQLRSVDYDVWHCSNCQSTEMWHYLNHRTKYQPCPKCKTIAYCLVSKQTIEQATYSSSGFGESIHACKFCGKSKKARYTIAQLVESSSSGSSGSSSGGSSGGSWGGGSSGGGGSSSSW